MHQFQRVTITLTEDHAKAIEAALASGEYGTTSEVIREALRDWKYRQQDREVARAQLKAEIEAGVADLSAGRVREWTERDNEQIKQRGRERLRTASSDSPTAPKQT
jgi:antitoxin ParD1/3/4